MACSYRVAQPRNTAIMVLHQTCMTGESNRVLAECLIAPSRSRRAGRSEFRTEGHTQHVPLLLTPTGRSNFDFQLTIASWALALQLRPGVSHSFVYATEHSETEPKHIRLETMQIWCAHH